MTGPLTLPSPSRMNAGGYGVTVRCSTFAPDALGKTWAQLFGADPRLSDVPQGLELRCWGGGLEAAVSIPGTVTPDGSLSIEPEPWAARHYRRAVMRGAGVYRWGLWAMFAPGRPAAEPDAQAGAALGCQPVNGNAQLDRFTDLGYAPRPDAYSDVDNMSFRVMRRRYGPLVAQARVQVSAFVGSVFARYSNLDPEYIVRVVAKQIERPIPEHKNVFDVFRNRVEATLRRVAKRLSKHLPQGREHRAQRRAFWAAIREVVGVLRRMLPRVRRPRQSRPVPRPLYSRAIPPAAPLAPPALA